jgi:pimeloyl-ACP methyl ester carboxylesterase
MNLKINQAKISVSQKIVNFRYYEKFQNPDFKTQNTNPKKTLRLIILHGWNQNGSLSWENFIQQIVEKNPEKNLQILAPDMPGFGLSDEPKEVWGALDYASWLNIFLKEIDGQQIFLNSFESQKWNILGHSFGGAVASIFTVIYPDLIQKLVLVAPAIIRKPPNKKQKNIQKISNFAKKIFSIWLLKIFYKKCRKIWYKIVGSPDYQKLSPRMSEIMQQVIRQDLQNYLSKITQETMICWGTLDKYTPFDQAFLVQKQIKNSKLEIFENINHGIHLHNCSVLAEKVSNFCE